MDTHEFYKSKPMKTHFFLQELIDMPTISIVKRWSWQKEVAKIPLATSQEVGVYRDVE